MSTIAELIDLTGKRAVVTGGAKGIGAAIARRLGEAGAAVTIADIDPHGEHVADEISAGGGTAWFVSCDVTDTAQVTAALGAAASGHHLDVLVNNAAIYPTTGPLVDASDEFVARMLEVNVRAQYTLGREGAKRMPRGGSIINLASIAGLRGGAGISAYSTSKGAVIAMTRAFASELGGAGIRVNAIAPGVIDTPGVQDQMAPLKDQGLDIDRIISSNPLGLAGEPDHVATVALFLASELSSFVTGQIIVVDGGATI